MILMSYIHSLKQLQHAMLAKSRICIFANGSSENRWIWTFLMYDTNDHMISVAHKHIEMGN